MKDEKEKTAVDKTGESNSGQQRSYTFRTRQSLAIENAANKIVEFTEKSAKTNG